MRRWLQRFVIFLLIAGLIVGGLGWATLEALRMEDNQRQVQVQKERAEKLRKALWRLDGTISPQLARENSRPFAHFSALHIPIPAVNRQGVPYREGDVRVPSPLMDAELPSWMVLHFQFTPDNKENHRWQSPQVINSRLCDLLRQNPFHLTLVNVTPEREQFLASLRQKNSGELLLKELRERAALTQSEAVVDMKNDVGNQSQSPLPQTEQQMIRGDQQYLNNAQPQRGQAPDPEKRIRNEAANSNRYAPKSGREVDPAWDPDSITAPNSMSCKVGDVLLSAMTPIWFPSAEQPDYLLYARLAHFEKKEIVQGIVMDWPALRVELEKLIADLFPNGRLLPLPNGVDPDGEGSMSALPVVVDPGPVADPLPGGWSPLRVGLAVAWAAVLLALIAMGLSGWSLIDLLERRVRFVSAVTHELRTPLTTLRLYLDMLTSGLVREEAQKTEYLNTLNQESERLHRLISNVLDFARLEKQSAQCTPTDVVMADLLDQLKDTWSTRCEAAGKTLEVSSDLPHDTKLHTDLVLVQQILGNLIDNACKYSKSAVDRRIFVRVSPVGLKGLAFEVEDCGPGVGRREWRAIFRPFRRGRGADTTAGGVGLGLALANRWCRVLGGRLSLCRGHHGNGACFRLELPK